MSYVDDKRKTYKVALDYTVRLVYYTKANSYEEAVDLCQHQDFKIIDKSDDDVDFAGWHVVYVVDDQEIINEVEDANAQ